MVLKAPVLTLHFLACGEVEHFGSGQEQSKTTYFVTGKGREEEGGGNLKSFESFQWAILFKVHTPPDWALGGGSIDPNSTP